MKMKLIGKWTVGTSFTSYKILTLSLREIKRTILSKYKKLNLAEEQVSSVQV